MKRGGGGKSGGGGGLFGCLLIVFALISLPAVIVLAVR
jgi:hypothetical protein